MKDIKVSKNKQILFSIFIITFFSISCSKKKTLDSKEYASWVEKEENGLSVKKTIDDFEFKLTYKPVDYIIAYELKNGGLKKDSVDVRKKELDGYQYYSLKIKSGSENEILKAGIKSENEYYERLEYMMNDMQNDIVLVDGKDTLPCAVYHFERNYGLSPYTTIVMSFEEVQNNSNLHSDKTFIYDDKMLGIGKVSIIIKKENIDQTPILKVN